MDTRLGHFIARTFMLWMTIVYLKLSIIENNILCQDIIIDVNIPGIMIIEDSTLTNQDTQTVVPSATTMETADGFTAASNSTTKQDQVATMMADVMTTEQTTDDSVSKVSEVTQETFNVTGFTFEESAIESTTAENPEENSSSIYDNDNSSKTEATTFSNEVTTDIKNSTPFRTTSTDRSIVIIPGILQGGMPCEKASHRGCNISNLERCVLIRERAPRCVCLTGYSRDTDGTTCIAVEQYMITLKTQEPFSDDLNNPTSNQYRQLEFDSREMLINAIQNSNLWAITKDPQVFRFRRANDGTVLIDYKIDISREYAPSDTMVREELIKGLLSSSVMEQSKIATSQMLVTMLEVSAPDPCTDPLLNHCDVTAKCQRSRRGFVCQCQQGSTDISYNLLEAPGEICSVTSCRCKNGGVCQKDANGISCRCPEWYLGSTCDIDGQAILIALICILGLTFLCCIFLCTYCYGTGKLRRRRRIYQTKSYLPETSIKERTQNIQYRVNYYPYHNYLTYPQLINYWQRPTTTLYSPRYTDKQQAIAWKWVEKN